MKLIPAGIGGLKENFLFNCTRNHACHKTYFIPIPSINEIMQFYADLPGLPDTYSIQIINDCDEVTGSAVSGTNIVGQKPDLSFYGVFGDITPDSEVTGCFYFKFTFSIDGSDYIFFTNYFCISNNCFPLMLLQGCYPNESIGADASDCNGIYYGFSNGEVQGTANYRYFHWAYVRDGEVNEQKNKMTFVQFNSKKAYKNTFGRESLLEFELVPTFYKNTLIGIFNRGNIRIDGNEWLLAEEQEISMIDTDSKLWKADILLAEECKQYFGCGVSDCTLPVPPAEECCSPTDVTAELGEEETPACCSPDIDSVTLNTTEGGVSSVIEPCCNPVVNSAEVLPLGDFLIEHEFATEGGETLSLEIQTTPGQTGTIVWGDGTYEAFDSGTGTFTLTHFFTDGVYRQKLYFDANSAILLFYANVGSGSVGFFSHSDNFTNLAGIKLTGILDMNDVVPPALSHINRIIFEANPVSGQTSMDFSVLTSFVDQLFVSFFPLLTSVSNIPSTVLAVVQLLQNPVLSSVGTIPAASSIIISQNNVAASVITGLDFSNIVLFQAIQNFSSSEVDSILAALVASGVSGGFATLQQSPPATPGPSGLADKATLISNGWFVSTD